MKRPVRILLRFLGGLFAVILALVAVGATLAAGAAQAGVHWSVGINLPVPPLPVIVAPAPVYSAPVYSAPVPVYAAPETVYYEPAPVYRRPYPVYVRPVVYPRYYRGWYDHDRRGHREHRAWR